MPGAAGGGSEVLALVEAQDLPRFNCSENTRDETRASIATSVIRTQFVVVQEVFRFFTVSFCTVVCDATFNAPLTWPCWSSGELR